MKRLFIIAIAFCSLASSAPASFRYLHKGLTRKEVVREVGEPEILYAKYRVKGHRIWIDQYPTIIDGVKTGYWLRYVDGKLEHWGPAGGW